MQRLLLGLLTILSVVTHSQNVVTQTYTTGGSFLVPTGINTITVECWGAGGAGGGHSGSPRTGGGGAGGAYVKSNLTVIPGNNYTVTVGVGGAGSPGDGNAGGDSWFDNPAVINARGGNGGGSSGGSSLGGMAPISGNVGTTFFPGGNGGDGWTGGGGNGNYGAGGGSSAGNLSGGLFGTPVPGAGVGPNAGGFAPAGGGNGGLGNNGNGDNGFFPGGGGGGAGSSASNAGGLGANGRVIVTYTQPTVLSVNATNSNGSYKIDDIITINVVFSDNVTVTGGTPHISLATSPARVATYFSGSGSGVLQFNYTVQAGDVAPDLDYTTTTALLANGANISSTADQNIAVITLPTPGGTGSIGGNQNIAIDGIVPAAPSTPDLAAVDDTGISSTDNITGNDANLTFTGTAESGTTVRLIDSGLGELANTIASSGIYSIDVDLVSGTYNLSTTATDLAGNISPASSTLVLTVDTGNPTVTVNQSGGQPDPANTVPVSFTIVFNEAINPSTFVPSDIILGGTAAGKSVSSLNTSDNITWTLLVTATGPGTITASLGAAAVIDFADNTNATSTSTDNTITHSIFSSNSDIVSNGAFALPANISYLNFLEANLTASSIEVARFDIRDGSGSTDTDGLPTILTNITFDILHASNLQRIAIYDGATEIAEQAASSTVTFSGLSLTAPDDGTKTFSIRASFQTTVADNQQIGFTVTSVTAGSGSTFSSADGGGATTSLAGDDNRIEVTATLLLWDSPLTTTPSNTDFSLRVTAYDANNNADGDVTESVTVSVSGGPGSISTSEGVTNPLTGGSFTWSLLQINLAGNYTVTCADAAGGLTLIDASTPLTVTTGDITAPTVTSINYQSPASSPTNATSLTFRVIFDEDVTGVDAADFTKTTTGVATGIVSVSPVNATTYDVTIASVSGNGTVRLDVLNTATILDLASNPYVATFVTGQVYAIDQAAPVFSGTAPATSAIVSNTQVSYTLSENISTGSITWTRTGGTADGGSPHVQALSGVGELSAGPKSNITLTNNPALVNGTIYSVAFAGTDAAGNNATVVTNTNVTYNALTAPTTQATNITFSSVTSTSMTVNWTNGNGASRLVLAKSGSTIDSNPANGTTYSANAAFGSGTQVGSGNFTVFSGTGNSVAVTGLSPNTTYFFEVFEFNGSGATSVYLTTTATGNPASQATTANPPTVQASNIIFSSITTTSMSLNWTNGNGASRIVVAHAGAPVDANPVAVTTYTSGAAFGSGSQIGTGNFVVGIGGSSVSVTALTPGTTYHFRVFEFNGTGTSTAYLTNTATGNPASQTTTLVPANVQATNISFSSVTATSMTLNWTNGNGASRLVVGRLGSAVNSNPVNGTSYTANAAFGTGTQIGTGNYVLFSGTGTTVNVTGLSSGATYHFQVFEFVGAAATSLYLTTTATGNPASQATLSAPVITAVAIPNVAMKIASVVTATITVNGSPETFTLAAGSTIGGFTLSNLVKSSNTSYTAQFTVANGGTDVPAGGNIPVNMTLTGGAGNSTAFTTAISQNADPIDANAPVFSAIAPATNATVANTQVSYTLSEALSAGTITWIRTGGTADPTPHIQTLAGTELAIGAHNAITLASNPTLVSGAIYSVSFAGTDAAGNTATVVTNTNITFNADTTSPTVVSINYQSPANALTNATSITYRVTFSEPVVNVDATDITKTLTGVLTGGAISVVAVSSSVFDVTFDVSGNGTARLDVLNSASIADNSGNTYNSSFTTGQVYTIDQTAPIFSGATPNSITTVTGPEVSYNLSEALSSGSITWTRTGGTADPIIHLNTLSGSELSGGAHPMFLMTDSPSLVAGAIYSVAYDGVDLAGNSAVTITKTNVTYLPGASKLSDIVASATFSYPQNIEYINFKEDSDIQVSGTSIAVAQFTIRDGGPSINDSDGFPTNITELTLDLGTNFSIIRRIALFDGSGTELTSSDRSVSTQNLSFTGLILSCQDNNTLNFFVRVSFVSVVTDNTKFSVAITSAKAEDGKSELANADGGGATTSTSGTNNQIEVIASELKFVQQPANTFVNEVMAPSPSIETVDANNNRDLDFSGSVGAISSGSLVGASTSQLTEGFGIFSSITHSAGGEGLTLTTNNNAQLTDGVSALFDIYEETNQIPITIRSIITPTRDDDQNNVLYIENIEFFPENSVKLFDRWGVSVKTWSNFSNYESSNPEQIDFDFTALNVGNYICLVEYTDTSSRNKKSQTQMITVLK